jgi:hypothetical protein
MASDLCAVREGLSVFIVFARGFGFLAGLCAERVVGKVWGAEGTDQPCPKKGTITQNATSFKGERSCKQRTILTGVVFRAMLGGLLLRGAGRSPLASRKVVMFGSGERKRRIRRTEFFFGGSYKIGKGDTKRGYDFFSDRIFFGTLQKRSHRKSSRLCL